MFKSSPIMAGVMSLVFCTSAMAYVPVANHHSHSIFENGGSHQRMSYGSVHTAPADEDINAAFRAGMIGGALVGFVLLTPNIFASIFGGHFAPYFGNGIR